TLARLTHTRIPQVRRSLLLEGQHYVLLDHLPGIAPRSFAYQPRDLIADLGRTVAELHSRYFYYYGDALGRRRFAMPTFYPRLIGTAEALIGRFYQNDPMLHAELDQMRALTSQLPEIETATYIMADMAPAQFLCAGIHLAAIHDTEAYVLGPRELDFIMLEYLLDAAGARAFAESYCQFHRIPPLTAIRPLYRFFLQLLGFGLWVSPAAHTPQPLFDAWSH
ncbi:MAG TPA: hypothetical protein PKC19_19835, partial [Roseiflexaceae bacterium]|nr:hypothetical protein [Roseiflexaceae bacterium]